MIPGMIAQSVRGGGTAVKEALRCAACKAEIPADARFCSACGAPVAAAVKCASCGHELDGDAKFCPGCGTKVSRGR